MALIKKTVGMTIVTTQATTEHQHNDQATKRERNK
jgi:hypothetical protein